MTNVRVPPGAEQSVEKLMDALPIEMRVLHEVPLEPDATPADTTEAMAPVAGDAGSPSDDQSAVFSVDLHAEPATGSPRKAESGRRFPKFKLPALKIGFKRRKAIFEPVTEPAETEQDGPSPEMPEAPTAKKESGGSFYLAWRRNRNADSGMAERSIETHAESDERPADEPSEVPGTVQEVGNESVASDALPSVETDVNREQSDTTAVERPRAWDDVEIVEVVAPEATEVAAEDHYDDEDLVDMAAAEIPKARSRFSFRIRKSPKLKIGLPKIATQQLRVPRPGDKLKEAFDSLRRPVTPVSPLYTISINDSSLRIMVARGSQVLKWAEAKLPEGIVRDGVVADKGTFTDYVAKALAAVRKDGRINGQNLAIAISGRNVVQRRFSIFDNTAGSMVDAVLAACAERMAIKLDELQLDWDAQPASGPMTGPDREQSEQDAKSGAQRHEVYAFGIYRNVVETNIRSLSEIKARFATAQPKALALAAAVNIDHGIVVDTEAGSLSVLVLKDGLPEVVREVNIDDGMTTEQWLNAVATHVSRTVAYYNSLYPDAVVADSAPLFLTGTGRTAAGTAREAVASLPYAVHRLPAAMRSTKEFPYAKYATNVGLAVLAGKRLFWSRAPIPLLPRPRLEFLPIQYQPKPFPIKAAISAVVVAGLVVGLGGVYQLSASASGKSQLLQSDLAAIERQVNDYAAALSGIRAELDDVNRMREQVRVQQAAIDRIKDVNRGYSPTLDRIAGMVPPDVHLSQVDDDGTLVIVSAEGDSYEALLDYVRLLESVGEFEDVLVRALGRSQLQAPIPTGTLPAAGAAGLLIGEPAEFAFSLKLEIVRGHRDDSAAIDDVSSGQSANGGSAVTSQGGN